MSDDEITDERESAAGNGNGDGDVFAYLQWGALVVLVSLAVVALLRFYTSASAAIAAWAAPAYEPAFQASFNLVVLLVCAVGVSLLARELRD